MIKVLYEDGDVAVCVKPIGVPSESATGEKTVGELLGEEITSKNDLYLLHRLDRNVGGVMVFAKHKKAAAFLNKKISDGALKKEYLAVTDGVPSEKNGVYKDLLFKDSKKGRVFVVDRMRKGVKDASLSYDTVSVKENKSLVHVLLHTGRTHQIRVQFASRKTPLCGDRKYGSKDDNAKEPSLFAFRVTVEMMNGETKTFCALPEIEKYPWNLFGDEINNVGNIE